MDELSRSWPPVSPPVNWPPSTSTSYWVDFDPGDDFL